FEVRFTHAATKATLEWCPQKGKNADIQTTAHALRLADDGLSGTCELAALSNGTYRLLLEEEHGIRTELEPRVLTVKVDQPPTFLMVAVGNKLPADRGKVGEGQGTQESTRRESAKENIRDVLPYDSVPLDIVLADDVGVERAELEYRINQGMAQLEVMPLDG